MFEYAITQKAFEKLCTAPEGFFRTKKGKDLVHFTVQFIRDKVGDDDADRLQAQMDIITICNL